MSLRGNEKITDALKIHLPPQLKIEVLEAAANVDRTASDCVRCMIEFCLHGNISVMDLFTKETKWGS